ncbi:MAG: NADPH-dependent 7-cyano-7-deazaguanine reductase QueF, partial [Alphaproteobacteria bacterium]|nr:NADPH-dependent 7-cyano-7-deazaguanine reductase QueF [Alphaproteobacteria bacterium]
MAAKSRRSAKPRAKLLGRKVPPAATPEDAELDRVANTNAELAYVVRFTCPEFTALCPITGQPDFAH